jgi:hypothetical protein
VINAKSKPTEACQRGKMAQGFEDALPEELQEKEVKLEARPV